MFGLTPYRRHGVQRRPGDIFDLEGVFENFFHDHFWPTFYTGGQMRVDIKENDKEYVVEAELPGVKKDEINVELNEDRLTIAVERKEETNEEKENYIRKERRYGSMVRSFYVPNILNDQVSAKFENGVLSIVLPKREPGKNKGNRIEIK
ncbi:Hsp20/alpha crystallin family protein [Thermincola potens]|uniref:Heat shock protein Hsp20 n=1 Tax=Thermincola potens (strain JR) TaxID=635013 RepID=D5XDC8_THEPJ|nr:Hsp20/alpha crystallin family protein [Thermincola potens]ADG81776.1 heat shock protein Hsp20 [Thermincola potens JR]